MIRFTPLAKGLLTILVVLLIVIFTMANMSEAHAQPGTVPGVEPTRPGQVQNPSIGPTTMVHQHKAAPKAIVLPKKVTGWHKTNLWKTVPEEWIRDNPGNWTAGLSDIGAMRQACGFSHMNYDDAIVHPGKPGAAHLHTYWGNTGTTSKSTHTTLRSSGNSTCRGGTANRSAYWVPTMIDIEKKVALAPDVIINYYKGNYFGLEPDVITPLPKGLRAVVGSMLNNDPTKTAGAFECFGPNGEQWERGGQFSNLCRPEATKLLQTIGYPICWNGQLDSPDHKSHLVNPLQNQNGTEMTLPDGRKVGGFRWYCPESHAKVIPSISFNIWYTIPPGGLKNYRLSCDTGDVGGPCMHADYFEAWKDEVRTAWNTNCLGKTRRDGKAHLSCDGKYFDGRP